MAEQRFIEAEYIEAGGQDDPDLNQAFHDFADQIKSEADAQGSIAVFEVPVDANGTPRPTTYNKTKLFTVPVGSATLDDICDRVLREFVQPGGKIMIQILARKAGERGVKLNRMIPLRRGVLDTGKSDGSTSGEIEKMLRMMNEQRQRDLADMRSLIENNRPPQIDPLAQSLAITEKLTNMAVAMSGRGAAPGTMAGAGATGTPNNPQSMMEQMMALMMTTMMKKFMSGMDGGNEKKEENNSWLKDIAELAKPLLEAKAVSEKTALVREQRMLAHERASPPPAPAGAESNAGAPKNPPDLKNTKEENDMKLLALLNEALPMLIDQVVLNDGDPVATAKLLLDGIPEDDNGLNDALYQLIQSTPEDFIAKISLADKRAKEHAPWFEKMRAAMLNEFDPDTRVPQTGSVA